MNKLIIIYIACIIIVLANAANKKIPKKSVHLINHAGLNDQWSDFKLKYNKKYINLIEETRRYVNIFIQFLKSYVVYIIFYKKKYI